MSSMTIGPRGSSVTSAKTLANVIPKGILHRIVLLLRQTAMFKDTKEAILAQSDPTQHEATLLQKDTAPWLVLSEFGTRHKAMSLAA